MSKKSNGRPAITPELPAALAKVLTEAGSGTFPTFSDAEMEKLPFLVDLLRPMLVDNPRHKGSGEARKVLREPIGMLSWDRNFGCWKFALGDKVLDFSGFVHVKSLLDLLTEVESQIAFGNFHTKRKKLDF